MALDNRKIDLVFKILSEKHLIRKNELPSDLRSTSTIVELLSRFSPEEVAETLAEEVRQIGHHW
jgi:DNA-directed RNA polymerase subunit F